MLPTLQHCSGTVRLVAWDIAKVDLFLHFATSHAMLQKVIIYPHLYSHCLIIIVLSFSRGLSPSDCDYNLLDVARRLEMYGIILYPARVSTWSIVTGSVFLSPKDHEVPGWEPQVQT